MHVTVYPYCRRLCPTEYLFKKIHIIGEINIEEEPSSYWNSTKASLVLPRIKGFPFTSITMQSQSNNGYRVLFFHDIVSAIVSIVIPILMTTDYVHAPK